MGRTNFPSEADGNLRGDMTNKGCFSPISKTNNKDLKPVWQNITI